MLEGAIEILYRALGAPVGVVIRTNDPTGARARFYRARQTDPQFEGLSIKLSHTSPESELWVVKKNPQHKDIFDASA